MGTVLAECPEHGLQPLDGILGGDVVANLEGNTTACPVCGRTARILDGRYQVRDSTGRPTIYSPTPAERHRLETVLHWAESELAKPDADEQRIAQKVEAQLLRDAPQLARTFRNWMAKNAGNVIGVAGLLIALLSMYVSSQGITAIQMEEILNRLGEQSSLVEPQPTTPADPAPTAPPLPDETEGPAQEA